MKPLKLTLLLAFLLLIAAQPSCLLDDPLTDGCLRGIDAAALEPELAQYLCTIAWERRLTEKAEEFCLKAMGGDEESGYRYLSALLVNGKLGAALRSDYALFFASPFDHNHKLSVAIEAVSSSLAALEGSGEQMGKLDGFEKAILYFYLKDPQRSLDQLTAHIATRKEGLGYEHLLMVRILEKQYKYYQALEYVERTLKGEPEVHPYLHHLRGNLLMHHVQFQKAIPAFERANLEFHKAYSSNGFSFSNYNLGLCHEKLGRIDQAINYYEKSVLNLPSAEALNALGHAHFAAFQKHPSNNTLQTAETYYRKALQAKPEYSIAVFNLGVLEMETKDFAAAITHFQACASSVVSCKYGLIKAYYRSNRKAEAAAVMASMGSDEDTVTDLSAILYELEDFSAALEVVGQREYKSSEVYQWKGFSEYALDRFSLAEASFARAVFLGNKQPSTYFSLGLAQLQLKKYAECAQSFDRAYRLDPRKETKEQRDGCRRLQGGDL